MCSSIGDGLSACRPQRCRPTESLNFEPNLEAFSAPAEVHADEGPVEQVKPQSESTASFQMAEIELTVGWKYFARIEEDGHVQVTKGFSTILRRMVQHVLVGEPKLAKILEIVRTI